jgi:hypothetical protein
MLIRLFIVCVLIVIVSSTALYLLTRNARYLVFAQQVLRLAVYLLIAFALLYILERYVLVGWGVLL